MEKLRFFNTSKSNNNVKLYSHLNNLSIRNKTGEISNVLSVSKKLGFIKQEDQFENRVVASEDTTNYKVVKTNDYAYNPARINVGSIARLKFHDNGIVSPMYVVFETKKSLNRDFFDNFLQSQKFNKQLKKKLVGSVRQTLDFKSLSDIILDLPDLIEQEKIGGFLSTFDNLIQKQQDKINLLKELKKGYLHQMFPDKEFSIPKIRFKGFTDTWEQCKFKDLFVKLQNNSLSRADLNDENGYAMNVHYGDVLIKFNEILDVNNENLPYITEPAIIEKYKSSFLQNGDIIIADAAEDNTVGKCCEIAGLSHEIVLAGLHTIPCRPSKNFASGYLGYYMNSNVYHDQLLPLIQGSKISSISINALANTSLVYPKSIEEQLLLANKFRALDSLIILHQYKLEGLVKIKKGYIQRLFA